MKKKEGFQGQRSYVLPATLLQVVRQQPLCQGLYITDIGYYPKAQFHNRARKTGIAQYVLIYCVQGEGWYQVQRGPRHTVKANQLFILPAHQAHRYRADNITPWTIYWLHFAGLEAEAFYQHVQGQADPTPKLVAPSEGRLLLFEDIFFTLNMSFDLNTIIHANQCLRQFLTGFAKRTPAHKPESEPNLIGRSIDFMSAHLDRNFTLVELARQAGLSVSHYSSSFRAQTQNSPLVFFSLLKMQRACQLLANTNERIKEIAFQLGFEDPYYFSRVFTKAMSMSPRQFRHADKA